jgi:DNA-binding transcriptional MerR regulator
MVQRSSSETPTNDSKSECSISDQSSSKSSLGRSSQSSNRSRECPQDELLEIITDFKNNVFTISEVERLVENWRNRNDVQQSFRDKQRQLSVMRDEYERIQKRIKDEMKAPTPFDRIRKFFTKGKKGQLLLQWLYLLLPLLLFLLAPPRHSPQKLSRSLSLSLTHYSHTTVL